MISGSPVLLSLTVAPLTKPLPPIETGTTVEPTTPEEGVIPLTNTPAPFTKNPFGNTATLPSGLVTTTLRAPREAPARFTVQLIWFWFTTTTPDATISGADELLRITVAPFWKPDPARLVIVIVLPVIPESGLILVTIGPGVLTMKPVGRIPDWPSVFITVTSHKPGDVPAGSVKVQVRLVASSTSTSEAKRSGFPVFESLTEAPVIKFVPVRFPILTVLPLFPEFGVMRSTVGAGPGVRTVKPLTSVPGALPGLVTVTFH